MAKINRKDAAERIAAMLNGRTQMTEAEYNEFIEELKANTVKDLAQCFRAGIVTNPDGTRYACIATMHRFYAKVEIIDEFVEEVAQQFEDEDNDQDYLDAVDALINEETEEPKTEKKAKAPKVKEVLNYTNKKGRTYNAANMISNPRFAQMLHKGYTRQQVFLEETVQEAYDRLAETFETVRIYSDIKLENGIRTKYAMCRN